MAAENAEKAESTAESARVHARAIAKGLTTRRILTREAFENATAVVMAVGGSTNAMLHLGAITHAAGVPLALGDLETIRAKVPVLRDLEPSGRYVTTDFHRAGGIQQVMRMLLEPGIVHGEALTITGQTVAGTLEGVPPEPLSRQDVLRIWSRPLCPQGHLGSAATSRPRARSPRSPA